MNCILIDDEKHCTETLKWEIENYVPVIKVLGTYNSPQAGLKAIEKIKPDVVFLDIEMPGMNGFDLLSKCKYNRFEVIFTTAYDQFAIKAIRFSALDYLLKPINKVELLNAIEKLKNKIFDNDRSAKIEYLLKNVKKKPNEINKIALPTMEGLDLVEIDDIVYCEAESNYTIFHLSNSSRIIISKTLKEIVETLEDHSFYRVHHSFFVNLGHVEKYVKGAGGYVIMSNGHTVNVSRSQKEGLVETLRSLY